MMQPTKVHVTDENRGATIDALALIGITMADDATPAEIEETIQGVTELVQFTLNLDAAEMPKPPGMSTLEISWFGVAMFTAISLGAYALWRIITGSG